MKKKLTCNQISALINFYLEGKLNERLKEYFENHLKTCPNCQKKVNQLRAILNDFAKNKINNNYKTIKNEKPDYETITKLCAYVDNELNTNENIKIKKLAINNAKVRKELETLYRFQKVMHSAYEKTKNDTKFDYSKNVMAKIQDGYEYSTTYFYKLATLLGLLLIAIIVCFSYLYFFV